MISSSRRTRSDLSEDAVKLKREIAKKRAEFEGRSRLRLGRARQRPAADRFPLVANFAWRGFVRDPPTLQLLRVLAPVGGFCSACFD